MKNKYMLNYLIRFFLGIRKKNFDSDNTADLINLNPSMNIKPIEKIIWIYWEGPISKFLEDCLKKIQKLNTNYEVNILNDKNISHFSTIPYEDFGEISPQLKTDVLRLDLLYSYGGIWIDASVILNENLNWIDEIIEKNSTNAFGYYRSGNTTNFDFPVIESWLLATSQSNPFFLAWKNELIKAIKIGKLNYINEIKKENEKPEDYFQNIGDLEYLIIYVACQVAMRKTKASFTLINCDKNAFQFQTKNNWNTFKLCLDLGINYKPKNPPKLIKIIGTDRKILEKIYDKSIYHKDSLLNFKYDC